MEGERKGGGREREHTAVVQGTLVPSSILHSESTPSPLLVFMGIFTRVYERCLKEGGRQRESLSTNALSLLTNTNTQMVNTIKGIQMYILRERERERGGGKENMFNRIFFLFSSFIAVFVTVTCLVIQRSLVLFETTSVLLCLQQGSNFDPGGNPQH